MRLFTEAGCVNCHRTIAQIADKANNNGLDLVPKDTGAADGRFKPSSLRNVAVRPRLRDASGVPARRNFTAAQRDALVAFLRTLTDSLLLRDGRYSDPITCRSAPAVRH